MPLETPVDSPAVIKGLTQDDLSTIHRKFVLNIFLSQNIDLKLFAIIFITYLNFYVYTIYYS